MDGVFMFKLWKCVLICMIAAAFLGTGPLVSDRNALDEEIIRLHVVANSDSAADQAVKLKVRDAIVEGLRAEMEKLGDVESAKAYLQENLPRIEEIANETLEAAGVGMRAAVSLCREAFDTRHYDTFSLPAGVYEALRVTIGDGDGKNWWCVVFPSLCIPATSEEFADVAAGAGFSDALVQTLEGKDPVQIRFFLLDLLGRLENIFFEG